MILQERIKYRRETSGHHKKGESKKGERGKKNLVVKAKYPAVSVVDTPFGDGEDESSHKEHVRYLKQLCSNYTKNANSIETLMKRTYRKRRYDITNTSDTASNIAEDYPQLKMPCGVSSLIFILSFLAIQLCFL